MSWTKRQLIEMAFEELGLANYVFDLTPEQLDSARRRLDSMMAGWNSNGIRVGYPIPASSTDGNIDDDSCVPDYANEAIYLNLAARIAPTVGKTLSQETKQFADMAYNNLMNQTSAPIIERQLPYTMPRGAGTKPWRNYNNPFINKTQEPVLAGSDELIQFT